MPFRPLLVAAVLSAAVAAQPPITTLALSVQSGGSNVVSVAPGASVAYAVVGTLSSAANEGLAMFSLDLGFSGGPLAPASAPTSAPMNRFDRPMGFTNPAGFGGTASAGALLQVGGAQNTINYPLGGFPSGPVLTGIAQPGAPATLVTGSLVAPSQPGTYTLGPSNVFANVIRQGETGVPFWRVDAAGPGAVTPLSVTVTALHRDVVSLSVSSPGVQVLTLEAGVANAGRPYWMLGTHTGTSPGLPLLSGITIPLNYDVWFQYTLDQPNGPILAGSLGVLNAQGQAVTHFVLPAGLPPEAASLTLHHAYVLLLPFNFASNPVALDLDP